MGLFQTLRQRDLARKIDSARFLVLYAAPGVSALVAKALIEASSRMPGAVTAVLDVSAHTARMGYGQFDSIEMLLGANVEVRQEPGLRQGLLIVDNHGWAFTMPAELIETDAAEAGTAPNAIELTMAQVVVLRGQLREAEPGKQPAEVGAPGPTLGAGPVTQVIIDKVKRELQIAPPQPFDLSRQVQVYTALVRFVELEAKGWRIEERRVELPARRLPVLATKDRGLKRRIRSSLKVLETFQDARLKELRDQIDEIRRHFCQPVGGYGSLVLVSAQAVLEQRVAHVRTAFESLKKAISAEIEATLAKVVDGLVPELARAVLTDPPDSFLGQYACTEDGAKDYVRRELTKAFPTADDIVSAMTLRLTFKDVTYSVLKDQQFKDKVLMAFSRSALPEGLVDEYDAAKRRAEAATKTREEISR